MADNPFDQFDTAASANPFDQFEGGTPTPVALGEVIAPHAHMTDDFRASIGLEPVEKSVRGDLSDMFLRGLSAIPELGGDLIALPANANEAIIRAMGGEPSDTGVFAGMRDTLRAVADVARGPAQEMDELGIGAGSVGTGSLVEALNPYANANRQEAAEAFALGDGAPANYSELTLGDRAGTVGRFALEQAVRSGPEMAAAVASLPAYVMGRTNQIAETRAENDKRPDVSLTDLLASAPAAAIEGTLERFTTGRLMPGAGGATAPGVTAAVGRIAKELGIQAPLGGVEEVAAYLGETLGTEKGATGTGAIEAFAGGAVGEGAIGGTVQGVKEAARAVRPNTIDPELLRRGNEVLGDPEPVPQARAQDEPAAPEDDTDLAELLVRNLLDPAVAAELGIDPEPTPALGDPDPADPDAAFRRPAPESAPAAPPALEAPEVRTSQPAQILTPEQSGQVSAPQSAPAGAGADLSDVPDPPIEIRYGKRRRQVSAAELAARDEELRQQYAPAELVEAAPIEEASHADPGEAPEAVTPEVLGEAIQTSADNTPRNLKQSREWLLGEVDKAVASASDESLPSDQFARIAASRAIGHVNFDVPGDGKFRVVNSKESLADFRAKVAKSQGFREKVPAPRGPQLNTSMPAAKRAEIMGEAEEVADDPPQTLASQSRYAPDEVLPMPPESDPKFANKNTLRQLRNGLNAPASASGRAWTPESVASVERQIGELEAEIASSRQPTSEALESVEDTPFFSALSRAVTDARGAPKRAGAEAWKQWLDGGQRRGEFKKGERDWLGVDAWLDGRESTTREEIAEFIRANEVQVEEVTLGDGVDSSLPAGWSVERNEDDDGFEVLDAQGIMRGEGATESEAIDDAQDRDARGEAGAPKFSAYQLPGGQNYRELLLTLPEQGRVAYTADNVTPMREGFEVSDPARFWYFRTPDNVLQIPKSQHPTEAEALDYVLREKQPKAPADKNFSSSHFDQPNILAHVRFNERTDADGKRVLFIEEIQSDWHQAGRKQGYRPDQERQLESMVTQRDAISQQIAGIEAKGAAATQADALRHDELSEQREGLQRQIGDLAVEDPGVPDAPFKATDEWAMLAFKRMVRHAAENGFDRIAWTTGAQQAARYDLSKQISRVTLTVSSGGAAKAPDGPFTQGTLKAYGLDGKEVMGEYIRDPARIEDFVGKEIAQKLLDHPGEASRVAGMGAHVRTVEGLDLKVGGEGMQAFYDKILPSAVNKWGKKFGGRVGDAVLPDWRFRDMPDMADRGDRQTVHAIDLTPSMRDAALTGQPLFQTENLSESDLTPSERAAFNRSPGLQAEQSREDGSDDADLMGLREAVDAVLGSAGVTVEYLRGYAGLPGNLRRSVESRNSTGRRGRTAGLYDPGSKRVFLFTDVVDTPVRAAFTAAHEVAGHHGLRTLLGDKLDAALNIALQNPTVAKLANAIATQRKLKPAQRLLAAEEALAELAAAVRTGDYAHIESRYNVPVPEGIRAKVARAVENFLRRLKALFDRNGQNFTDEDVRELLEAAWQAVDGASMTIAMPDGSSVREQVVFHGTPHTVDRFSLQKIGTGEGAQAYGWGLYFASRRDVAESYRKLLSGKNAPSFGYKGKGLFKRDGDTPFRVHDDWADAVADILVAAVDGNKSVQSVLDDMRDENGRKGAVKRALGFTHNERLLDVLEGKDLIVKPVSKGQTYKVDVPEDSDLLDWDAPLSEQPKKVRAALTDLLDSLGLRTGDYSMPVNYSDGRVEQRASGSTIYRAIVRATGGTDGVRTENAQAASEALMAAGIPGLRYLDGGSRSAGDGSRNYVIWDEAAIGDPENAERDSILESVEADDVRLPKSGPRAEASDVRRADRREAADPGMIQRAKQDVADQLAGWRAMAKGRPKSPETIARRANALRGFMFDSVVSRARDLEARNPDSKALPKLFNQVFSAPGDKRLVAEILHDATERRFATFTNRVRNTLDNEGMTRLTEEQNDQLRAALLGTEKNLPAPIERAAKTIRKLMDTARDDLTAAGVEIGEVDDIGYLTRLYDDAKILSDEPGFLKVAARYYRAEGFRQEVGPSERDVVGEDVPMARFLAHAKRAALTDEKVAAGVDEIRELLKATRRSAEPIDQRRAIEGIVASITGRVADQYAATQAAAWLHKIKTPTVSEVFNGVGPSGAPLTKARVLTGAADTIMAGYMNTNVLDILEKYARTTSKKIATAERFGPKGEKVQQLIDTASREGVPARDLQEVTELMESALGHYTPINERAKNFLDGLQAWTYLGLLSRVAFSSMAEAMTVAIRTGNIAHAAAPLVQVYRAAAKTTRGKELRDMALMIGINGNQAMEEVMQNQLGGDYGMEPKWSKLIHRFMSGVGLMQLTRAQRAYGVGAATGYLRWIAGNVAAGKRTKEMGVYLNELGIGDHEAFANWMAAQGTLPDQRELYDEDGRPTPRGQDYMGAVRRFVDQTTQNPTAAHRPQWMNNPYGRVAGSITGFSYAAYENIIKREIRLTKTLTQEAGKGAASRRLGSALAGAAALAVGQTVVSTIRELLFNAARFEDKDDEEIAKEMMMLGLSRSFGLGSADPIIQYLTGLKYSRSIGETFLGASIGTLAQRVDAAVSVFTDRNSPNTDTTEYRALEAIYSGAMVPIANAVLSRIPYVSALAIPAVSDRRLRDRFAGIWFDEPERESEADRKYAAAVKELEGIEETVRDQLALKPDDQWAHELIELKAEYAPLLDGVTLDLYKRGSQDGRFGPGDAKRDDDGRPRLKLGDDSEGSVLGELEGYPYWYSSGGRRKQATSEGIEDRIRDLNKAIKRVREGEDLTRGNLVEITKNLVVDLPKASELSGSLGGMRPFATTTGDGIKLAGRKLEREILEELQEARRTEKRRAVDLIEAAKAGKKVKRPPRA